ncbi:hypothetical protein VI817_002953 [Penicillium citrinum]|nr:hypothetical protein VI817_002953 [Penicillium citrinum]
MNSWSLAALAIFTDEVALFQLFESKDAGDWSHFKPRGSGGLNEVEWEISDSGELFLNAIYGGGGDQLKIYVEGYDVADDCLRASS